MYLVCVCYLCKELKKKHKKPPKTKQQNPLKKTHKKQNIWKIVIISKVIYSLLFFNEQTFIDNTLNIQTINQNLKGGKDSCLI